MIRNMIQSLISIQDKKDYILWFLNNHYLKNREGEWLLNYLLTNDDLLNKLEFVRPNTPNLNRGLIINSLKSHGKPLLFYKKHISTEDMDKAFHDFRMDRNSPIFIEFHYEASLYCPLYLSVLTEKLQDNAEENKRTTDNLLEYLSFKSEEQKLNTEINQALDQNDPVRFLKLTEQLNLLKEFYHSLEESR